MPSDCVCQITAFAREILFAGVVGTCDSAGDFPCSIKVGTVSACCVFAIISDHIGGFPKCGQRCGRVGIYLYCGRQIPCGATAVEQSARFILLYEKSLMADCFIPLKDVLGKIIVLALDCGRMSLGPGRYEVEAQTNILRRFCGLR